MEDITEIEPDLNNLLVWIEIIGENYGAIRDRFFRHESKNGEASALAPPARQMETIAIVIEKNLRLYCMVVNEHVEFLFNGGIKTVKYADDCPNIKQYFNQANTLENRIDRLFHDEFIQWNKDYSEIQFEPGVQIEL